jgi:hypothetical protein
MQAVIIALIAASASVAVPAAGSREVQYGTPADWVLSPPRPTESEVAPGAPVQIVYSDQQTRLSSAGAETYVAYRMKLLTPESLAAGNITAAWDPSAGEVTVHHVRIRRNGEAIDVLKSQKFQVLQREGSLEQSVLKGELTAVMQTPGLRVGDEIEFAATVRRRDPTLGDRAFGLSQLPLVGVTGAFRYRFTWPESKPVKWRSTPDLAAPTVRKESGQIEIVYDIRDPKSAVPTDGAPPRFNVRRLVEYSDFGTWADVSKVVGPLFESASRLAPNSELRSEASKIARASADPVERAEAALALVQDRIRYVYVGLDGGNFRPASADETWERRFGDCKGKTAVLLALLRELGIPAEAVLVNQEGGDGLDERLPNPALFDHVLVRARIGARSHWLDGTRAGDRYLDQLPDPAFRWALPLGARSAGLEKIPAVAPKVPQLISILDIDAGAGFDQAARISVSHILRGDESYATQSALRAMSVEDADRAIRAYWSGQDGWVEAQKVSWRFDERSRALVLALEGTGKLEWEGSDGERTLSIHGAGFTPPSELRRPKEQDQSAPWLTDFPRYRCWVTTIKLPPGSDRWGWDYRARKVDRVLGGVAYWRVAELSANVMRTVMSRRVMVPEISAEGAAGLNAAIAGFDNKISQVFQVPSDSETVRSPSMRGMPKTSADWARDSAACSAPEKKVGVNG